MGYQIGNICYNSKQEAENVYFSKVIPIITEDGKLYQLYYNKQTGWHYQQQKLQIYLPECNPAQNFKNGMEMGAYFTVLIVMLWGFNQTRKLLERLW